METVLFLCLSFMANEVIMRGDSIGVARHIPSWGSIYRGVAGSTASRFAKKGGLLLLRADDRFFVSECPI